MQSGKAACFLSTLMLSCQWRCNNGRRLALPRGEVMLMVTYSELFAYSLVLVSLAGLIHQICKRK